MDSWDKLSFEDLAIDVLEHIASVGASKPRFLFVAVQVKLYLQFLQTHENTALPAQLICTLWEIFLLLFLMVCWKRVLNSSTRGVLLFWRQSRVGEMSSWFDGLGGVLSGLKVDLARLKMIGRLTVFGRTCARALISCPTPDLRLASPLSW